MLSKKYSKKKTAREDVFAILLISMLGIFIILMLLISNIRLYSKNYELKKKSVDLNKELYVLESKNEELENLFMQASQKDHLEKIIREKGLYKKPGEEVVVVVPPESSGKFEDLETPESRNVWDKILEYFKSIF